MSCHNGYNCITNDERCLCGHLLDQHAGKGQCLVCPPWTVHKPGDHKAWMAGRLGANNPYLSAAYIKTLEDGRLIDRSKFLLGSWDVPPSPAQAAVMADPGIYTVALGVRDGKNYIKSVRAGGKTSLLSIAIRNRAAELQAKYPNMDVSMHLAAQNHIIADPSLWPQAADVLHDSYAAIREIEADDQAAYIAHIAAKPTILVRVKCWIGRTASKFLHKHP